MIIAALLAFGALLAAWLMAPAEARPHPAQRGEKPRMAEAAPEALAEAA